MRVRVGFGPGGNPIRKPSAVVLSLRICRASGGRVLLAASRAIGGDGMIVVLAQGLSPAIWAIRLMR